MNGQVAVITGATGGIGYSVAFALAQRGVSLYLLGRDREKLDSLDRRLSGMNSSATTYRCELSSVDEIRDIAQTIISDASNIDILIHAAGSIVLQNFEDMTEEDLDSQYFLNVRAPFLLTKLLLPSIRARKGQIVFVNSSASQQKTKKTLIAYTASKYALLAVADGLRDEVNADGVRVLTVFPGRTATEMQKRVYEFEKRDYAAELLMQPDDVANTIVSALTMPRSAEITDISIRPFHKN